MWFHTGKTYTNKNINSYSIFDGDEGLSGGFCIKTIGGAERYGNTIFDADVFFFVQHDFIPVISTLNIEQSNIVAIRQIRLMKYGDKKWI